MCINKGGFKMMTTRKTLPDILTDEEAKRIIEIPNKRYYTGLRNKAMITLMVNTGLRVSEVVNLKTNSIDLGTRDLKVVNGKGHKDRNLKIPEKTAELIKVWLKKKAGKTYLFTTKEGEQLKVRYIQAMIKRYSVRAGINKNIYPHTLRHTFATNFYRQTKDIETLRKLLGHSDISTTQIYVTLANIDVENAMNNFREIT
jgi:integrase/recombinase XerD